jgi:hypothetical protein
MSIPRQQTARRGAGKTEKSAEFYAARLPEIQLHIPVIVAVVVLYAVGM